MPAMPKKPTAASANKYSFRQKKAPPKERGFFITDDPMKSEAAVRLVKSFLRIPNRQLAEKMFEMMEILSKSNWRLQKEEADTD